MSAADYAEKHGLGELMCEMLNGLIVSKPEKPVDFLIELLGKDTAPRFIVVAPPGFVLEGAIDAVVAQYNVVPICLAPLVEEAKERIFDGKTIDEHQEDGKPLPDKIVVKLLSERLVKPDCVEKGWVLDGVPVTKGQAQQLVAEGHVPDKVVYMAAPDDTIVKSVPAGEDAFERKKALAAKLQIYRRNIDGVGPIFSHISKELKVENAYAEADACKTMVAFLDSKMADPGLRRQPQTW